MVRFDDQVEVLEVAREDARIDGAFIDHLVRGPFRHLYLDGASSAEVVGRLLGVVARNPAYLLTFPAYSLYRLASELPWLGAFLNAAARGRASIRPMVFVVHDFLSSDELDTPLGRARTDACVFRVPVNGEMVSMCKLNGTSLRDDLNRSMIPASGLVR